ncbi:hypothetical protein MNBD_ALPHA06-1786 [hydrothermal vent metagenome]|uniref:Beta-lactamase hydrolase-like protein phosphatase-like domain-containing protein n=1 Tax=hydrothermal vent metagenome TaxID=652676 RepID=A0A3B0S0Z8_9ZZZZ
MKIRHLSDSYAASPQIQPKDVKILAEQGFTAIINHRPDGEKWGQPKSEAIAAAAKEAGLDYFYIPISLRGLAPGQVEECMAAQAKTTGKILAFCNTGIRVANLWGLSQAKQLSADEIIKAGTNAGYNLNGLRGFLGQ